MSTKKPKHQSRTQALRKRLHATYGMLVHTGELVRENGKPTKRLMEERNVTMIAATLAEANAVVNGLLETMASNGLDVPWKGRQWRVVFEMDDDEEIERTIYDDPDDA